MLAIWHIYCAPHRSQTIGKIERFHETLKATYEPAVLHEPGGAASH
jgi:hypothetical protein